MKHSEILSLGLEELSPLEMQHDGGLIPTGPIMLTYVIADFVNGVIHGVHDGFKRSK